MCLFKCLVHWDRALSNELLSEVFIHLWCLFSLMVCFCSNIWLGYHPSLFCTICRVFSVIQTGLNGHGCQNTWGKNSPVGDLPFLALSKYMRPCVGRRALRKQAPTRGVWCNGGRSGRSGYFIVWTHWWKEDCSEQHVTLHPCDGWKLIQPSMWARAGGSRQDAHVTRPMWWLFRGKPLTAERRNACNLVYFEAESVQPLAEMSVLTGSRVYCWKASAVWMWMLFLL